jgi:hypothetical protein
LVELVFRIRMRRFHIVVGEVGFEPTAKSLRDSCCAKVKGRWLEEAIKLPKMAFDRQQRVRRMSLETERKGALSVLALQKFFCKLVMNHDPTQMNSRG